MKHKDKLIADLAYAIQVRDANLHLAESNRYLDSFTWGWMNHDIKRMQKDLAEKNYF